VQKPFAKTLGLSIATAALALMAYGASAQEKKPAKMAACTTVKDETGCTGRADCAWTAEKKDKKGKVTAKAACKAKPKAPAKKEKK
jgi:hypothetical protein